MALLHIFILIVFTLVVGWLMPARWRGLALLGGSVVSIYWLQSSTPIRNLDFWLPSASIALTVFVWAVTRPAEANSGRSNLVAVLVIIGLVLAIGITRYIEPLCCLTPSRPPDLWRLLLVAVLASTSVAITVRLAPGSRLLSAFSILLILTLFIVLKTDPLAARASAWLRVSTGQAPELASPLDLRWLGFSYLAFRLLHALRDSQAGRLPAYTLGEFVTYAIFFPAYTAGPIDRSQRFVNDLRKQATPEALPASANLAWGSWRILMGIFKKFVLADSLALIALNAQNATQVTSTGWMWVLLYAYTLRIYFDFSGYTDIALGLGRLVGIQLPENFDRPYLKQNLTAFWNSWHITLAQWFRAYFFNPLTRFLRTRPKPLPTWVIVLAGQTGVMLLIGLWHGVTWNFIAWGAWHAFGLFLHNRWSEWNRPRLEAIKDRPRLERYLQLGGWLLTFHYVALGWVWFALPAPDMAWNVVLRLFGAGNP